MLFIELRFFVFFLVVFLGYWALPGNRPRKCWLLAASYLFYAAWDWRFLSLILVSTFVDYIAGRAIHAEPKRPARLRWVALSVATNLGILGFFKYFGFFVESFAALARAGGWEPGSITLDIVLPVGISFYTFQTMSYTLDIHRRKIEPRDSLLDFALFVAFFPQLVAGPIVRARDFLPQLDRARHLGMVDFRWALRLFLVGFVKKACISDNLAPYVDAFFAEPLLYDAVSGWVATILYSIQIYCDFSGYSDMAIATAGLLGYRLRENFNAPYLARNITDFWRRWHMSLSTWLRDYLYISLGGNRHGALNAYRNVMITMLLGGLWHGASWNFVAWGFLHGVALIAHRLWRRARQAHSLSGPSGWALTYLWVLLTWIPFRSTDFGKTADILVRLGSFGLPGRSLGGSEFWVLVSIAAGLGLIHGVLRGSAERPWWRSMHPVSFAVGYGAAFSLAIAFMPMGYRPFIYFQF